MRALFVFNMQQGVMRLLALSATMKRLTLLDKMARPQAVHAETICLHTWVDIILSCGRDFNCMQAYSGCLSVLQRTQLVVESAVLAVKDATGLLDGGFLFVL